MFSNQNNASYLYCLMYWSYLQRDIFSNYKQQNYVKIVDPDEILISKFLSISKNPSIHQLIHLLESTRKNGHLSILFCRSLTITLYLSHSHHKYTCSIQTGLMNGSTDAIYFSQEFSTKPIKNLFFASMDLIEYFEIKVNSSD